MADGNVSQVTTESGDLKITSKTKKKNKKSKGGKGGEGDVYDKIFELGGQGQDFPSALLGENDSEGDQTPRMALSKEEWNALNGIVTAAVTAMQQRWDTQMNHADSKLANIKTKVESLQKSAKVVGKGDWLLPKQKELEKLVKEQQKTLGEVSKAKEQLKQLEKDAEAQKEELEKLKNQEALKDEWDRKVREAAEELEELEDSKGRLEGEISELEDEKQNLIDQVGVQG